jgi:hypothetical protein
LEEWVAWLEQSTAFVNFAQAFLERHGKVAADFRADDAVLREFQQLLRQTALPVSERQWQSALPFLRMRIEAEILNQVFGIETGNEVEVRADPQVAAAVGAMEKARQLLSGVPSR